MPRAPRSYLPGTAFHITARTQGRAAWFTSELCSQIVQYIAEGLSRGVSSLFAFCVMPTHLHLVLRQGELPLARTMHPILQRTSILVQKAHRVEGHVFQRRFFDRPCFSQRYLRNAIGYTNVNPMHAGLCTKASDYPWSSHAAYCGSAAPIPLLLDEGLALFSGAAVRDREQLHEHYREYVRWRLARDAAQIARGEAVLVDPAEDCHDGDESEAERITAPLKPDWLLRLPREDLSEIALSFLNARRGPELRDIRCRARGRALVAARRDLIIRLIEAGFRTSQIARFVNVADCTVTKLRARSR